MFLLYTLGYRHFHLYGYDSSYVRDEGHAYEQKLNDGEKTIEVEVHGRKFITAPWMVTQSQDFLDSAEWLTSKGCQITIRGDGLLPFMASTCLVERQEPILTAADVRCSEILKRIESVPDPVGVEVGVFAGELSKRLLKRPDLTLHMVDDWGKVGSKNLKPRDHYFEMPGEIYDGYRQLTMRVTEFAGDRGKIYQGDSVEAASHFEDGSLDFVFLDADHTYEGLKADIEAWYPKVKKGGLFCGHDYANHEYAEKAIPKWGVEQAVDEFCKAKGLTVDLGDNFTWFTTKGE